MIFCAVFKENEMHSNTESCTLVTVYSALESLFYFMSLYYRFGVSF